MRRLNGAKPSFSIPKTAPLVVPKTERDGLIASCSPFAVAAQRELLRKVDSRTPVNLLRVYLAIVGHVNAASGLASCSQARIAALLNVSRKTVSRQVAALLRMGLLAIDHRRPAPGGRGVLLFLRPIYGPDSVHSVMHSGPELPMGQHSDPQADQKVNSARPVDKSPMGHLASIRRFTYGTPRVSQLNGPTYGTPNMSPELSKALNPHETGVQGQFCTAASVIETWLATAEQAGYPVVSNEADLTTAQECEARAFTQDRIAEQIRTFYGFTFTKADAPDRLAPVVDLLLSP